MNFSLNMLKKNWKERGIDLNVSQKDRAFYSTLRVILLSSGKLEDNILYLVKGDEKFWESAKINTRAGFLFGYKPNEEAIKKAGIRNYAWVEFNDEDSDYVGQKILNNVLESLEELNIFAKELNDCIVEENGHQRMLELICSYIGNPGFIVDRSFRMIAMIKDYDLEEMSDKWKRLYERGYMPYDIVTSIINNPEWNAILEQTRPEYIKTKEFKAPFIAYNLRYKNQRQWQLYFLELYEKITPADLDILEATREYMVASLVADSTNFSQKETSRELFIRDVMAGELTEEYLIERELATLGWKINGAFCAVRIVGVDSEFYQTVLSVLEKILNGSSVIYEDKLYVIFSMENPFDYFKAEQNLKNFFEDTSYYGALGTAFFGFQNVRKYTHHLDNIVEYVKRLGVEDRFVSCKDYNLTYMYRELEQKMDKCFIMEASLDYITEYDSIHNTNYYETLREFLNNERNLVKTARKLSIHRNTLVYRVEKIQEFLPMSLDDEAFRFRLLLSYNLKDFDM